MRVEVIPLVDPCNFTSTGPVDRGIEVFPLVDPCDFTSTQPGRDWVGHLCEQPHNHVRLTGR